jgi:hypothetical protein
MGPRFFERETKTFVFEAEGGELSGSIAGCDAHDEQLKRQGKTKETVKAHIIRKKTFHNRLSKALGKFKHKKVAIFDNKERSLI